MGIFSVIKEYINIRLLLKIVLSTLLLQQSVAWADVECRFGQGYGNTTVLTNSTYTGGPIRIPPPGGGFYTIATFNTGLTPTLTAHCSLGKDGEDLWGITDPSVFAGSLYHHAIFETNIPGVVYTVYIHTTDGYGGYFASDTSSYTKIAADDGAEGNWDGKTFNATIEIRVTDDFHGNPNDLTVITPKAGTLGSMSLGVHTGNDNQPWKFTVDESSFQIPVILPTCDITALSTGNNTVDMGDYYVSDIKGNNARKVPFAITASDCTSVAKITTKMTSTMLTGNNLLLGNTLSGEAAGMGVKIYHGDNQTLVPNDDTSLDMHKDDSIPGSITVNFNAQLVPDGNAFKAGQFKATSIFTMSYD
ncbi:fimbrial protein [Citrobacter portucalensis]|uniref:fimbrial protein n=1 Tax=Citrobacter portucalensis TaxID=1639133 RepID=UPI00351D8203